jgi:hypothetical protein
VEDARPISAVTVPWNIAAMQAQTIEKDLKKAGLLIDQINLIKKH